MNKQLVIGEMGMSEKIPLRERQGSATLRTSVDPIKEMKFAF
jgi:hypothetical protein